MNNKRAMMLIALGLLVIPACSGADQSSSSATDTAPVATTSTTISGSQLSSEPLPPPELDPGLTGDDLWVAIEGRWMCDVQRYAFSDLGVLNKALDDRLAAHGLNRTEYEAFKAQLETKIELREQVLTEYDAYCGED
jgi:hypothetical protein